jgi:hypothetical protein
MAATAGWTIRGQWKMAERERRRRARGRRPREPDAGPQVPPFMERWMERKRKARGRRKA